MSMVFMVFLKLLYRHCMEAQQSGQLIQNANKYFTFILQIIMLTY